MSSIFVSDHGPSAFPSQVSGDDAHSWRGDFARVPRWLKSRVTRRSSIANASDMAVLRKAITELPELDREALRQQVHFGLTIPQIAARLYLPESDVRTVLARARGQLRLLCGEDVSLDPTS